MKIKEDNKNLILKLSPNKIFNLKRKENNDSINTPIKENISIKKSINIVYEELKKIRK